MRLTIIPDGGIVCIDGLAFSGIDMSSISSEVHAIQWYGSFGEIEKKDPLTRKMIANEAIDSIDEYQTVISLWEAKQLEHNQSMQSVDLSIANTNQ